MVLSVVVCAETLPYAATSSESQHQPIFPSAGKDGACAISSDHASDYSHVPAHWELGGRAASGLRHFRHGVEIERLLQIVACLGLFPVGCLDCSRVIKKHRVTRSGCERLLNLLLRLGVLTIRVESPGVSVKGPDVVAVPHLHIGDAKRFLRLAGVVRVVGDQLHVGVIR